MNEIAVSNLQKYTANESAVSQELQPPINYARCVTITILNKGPWVYGLKVLGLAITEPRHINLDVQELFECQLRVGNLTFPLVKEI